ncbi:TRPM8 channel-associated factor homolog [Pelobates fuscus]|uniref:TRPM8 channel-associated factor homolog n=1 Tax=Pelobates fuscus TaxID=191477 RepID=UPI002FE4C1CF
MTFNEDYQLLVKGLSELDFIANAVPCKLLLTGDSVFPVLVTPSGDVLIAASRYGKGRVVVVAHEAYLNNSNLLDFMKNAVSWLKPSAEAVIGVNKNLHLLSKLLCDNGCTIKTIPDDTQGLGVMCMDGYNDSQAKDIISFLQEGGGLLIGAQAWHWSSCNKNKNVLFDFPGNKIISVSGIYFLNKYGEKGKFSVSKDIPRCPVNTDVNFSTDLKDLLRGVSILDISGPSIPSQLLLHGPLTFPIGLNDSNQCFLAAAIYGKGRVVVVSHESYLMAPELKTVILNAISWLDSGKKRNIGVNKNMGFLNERLQQEGINSRVSDVIPGLDVYCCNSYNDTEAECIKKFVAEGGGLLIGGQAWYWSIVNPSKNALLKYPGNKILNTFGISILGKTTSKGVFKAIDPEAATNCYHFPRAFSQLVKNLQDGVELKPPLSSWLNNLKEDASSFMSLPSSPLVLSVQRECVCQVKRCGIPKVSQTCPVKNNSKDGLLLQLAEEIWSFSQANTQVIDNFPFQKEPSVTVHIDGTNPGADAWRSTGLYLPPEKTAALVFPDSVIDKGLQVQVGCQTDDLSSAEKLCRAPVVVKKALVPSKKMFISCVWGGLLYIIVPAKSRLGTISVTVYGAEPAPLYIKGKTSVSSWLETIRTLPAPWAELVTENIILTVPSSATRSLNDPEDLLSLWDKIMEAVAELAAIPKKLPRPERIVADVQISAGWLHSGYPIMCHWESAGDLLNIESIRNTGLWGPIHELGHNQQKWYWEFPSHTTEATCNLWSVYVHETVLKIPRNLAHGSLQPKSRADKIKQYLENGANLEKWHVWTALETYLQLQEGFGWDPFKHLFAEYQAMSGISNNNKDKMNLWAVKFSEAVNRNLTPFFKAWGWPIDDKTCAKLSGLPEWKENPMTPYLSEIKA